jgi:hypothetical protein
VWDQGPTGVAETVLSTKSRPYLELFLLFFATFAQSADATAQHFSDGSQDYAH